MYAYLKVCESIINDLENGKFQPDQKLPTEREMCEQFDVSISTIRKAMYYLRDKGLIYSKRGSGYYVTRKVEGTSSLERPSLSNLGLDSNVQSEMHSFQIRRCNITEARDLKIKVHSIIYEIRRIRRVKGRISSVEYTLIPVEQVPNLLEEDAMISLNKAFVKNGIERVKVTNKLVHFDDFNNFKNMGLDYNKVNFNMIKRLEKLDGKIIEFSKILIFDQELNFDYVHLY